MIGWLSNSQIESGCGCEHSDGVNKFETFENTPHTTMDGKTYLQGFLQFSMIPTIGSIDSNVQPWRLTRSRIFLVHATTLSIIVWSS